MIPALPCLAIPLKKAIIRNRWKLKSRRDLKVLEHFQARAGVLAPTRNSQAVHDDILIIQRCPFLHKQSACAAGEMGIVGWGGEQTVRLHAAGDSAYS